jgi:hypothetical protein
MADTETETVVQEQQYVELTGIRMDGKPFNGIAVLHADPENFKYMHIQLDPKHITHVSRVRTEQFGWVGYVLQSRGYGKPKVSPNMRLVKDPEGLVAKLVRMDLIRSD